MTGRFNGEGNVAANGGGGNGGVDAYGTGLFVLGRVSAGTGAMSKAQVNSLKNSQRIIRNMHGFYSRPITQKILNWRNIGKGAKFLGTAGNIAGMMPTAWDMTVNGNFNGDNTLDLMIGGTSFVPVFGWVLSPTFSWYANGIRNEIATAPDGGASVIERLNFSTSGYPGAQCFAAGTQVLMGDGSFKKIELVQIGDTVFTYNSSEKKFEKNPVVKVAAPVHHKLVKVRFSNGEQITSTEDHPYYVKGKGWCSFNPAQTLENYGMKTKQLIAKDVCFTYEQNKLKKVKVLQIIPFEDAIKTYNLTEIVNSNNYFVNGILVNNESLDIPLNDNTK
ncbi:MAG: hypothetical protein JXP36_15085 [Bacteroidales bacterium]|nr:hypothetical protein [Bacteroidales bacterium]